MLAKKTRKVSDNNILNRKTTKLQNKIHERESNLNAGAAKKQTLDERV